MVHIKKIFKEQKQKFVRISLSSTIVAAWKFPRRMWGFSLIGRSPYRMLQCLESTVIQHTQDVLLGECRKITASH